VVDAAGLPAAAAPLEASVDAPFDASVGAQALHELGRIVGAWGVKGWIKVEPHAGDPQTLLTAHTWRLEPPDSRPGAASTLDILQARRHGAFVVAQVRGVTDRDAADALRGLRVVVPRAEFPATAPDEFYWVDLIGLEVHNREAQCLGTVVGLLDTGTHAVLRVRPSEPDGDERLIPFVAAYVDDVDLAARTLRVDWGLDY